MAKPDSSKGGKARAANLTPEQRRNIARRAAHARWSRHRRLENADVQALVEKDDGTFGPIVEADNIPFDEMPEAKYRGVLRVLDSEIPCYVLEDGRRVIGRTSATEMLTGIKGGGAFEKYIGVAALRPFVPVESVLERMVSFRLPEVEGLDKAVKGMPADVWLDVCEGFVKALHAHNQKNAEVKMTPRQIEMAIQAGMFVASVARVGLDALIDEATGYQYDRVQDALQVKLHAYLDTEMRKWEKTFPDELWVEFGRLTGWRGRVTQRPKYWGKLVMELVYEYLDADVARWLEENAPAPRHGQNYHQWLSAQYGLRRLVEHIWKLVGIAKTCENMVELKDKMAEIHGKTPVQYRLYLPMPTADQQEKRSV